MNNIVEISTMDLWDKYDDFENEIASKKAIDETDSTCKKDSKHHHCKKLPGRIREKQYQTRKRRKIFKDTQGFDGNIMWQLYKVEFMNYAAIYNGDVKNARIRRTKDVPSAKNMRFTKKIANRKNRRTTLVPQEKGYYRKGYQEGLGSNWY